MENLDFAIWKVLLLLSGLPFIKREITVLEGGRLIALSNKACYNFFQEFELACPFVWRFFSVVYTIVAAYDLQLIESTDQNSTAYMYTEGFLQNSKKPLKIA